MNGTTESLMQLVTIGFVITAGFAMIAEKVRIYRVTAVAALTVASLQFIITGQPMRVFELFAMVFIVTPIFCLAIVNLGIWVTWRRTRTGDFSQLPEHPPRGYLRLSRIYRLMWPSSGETDTDNR